MHFAGIPMKFHSQATWHELDIWVNRLGVDPMFAIRAATYWPSVAMRVSNAANKRGPRPLPSSNTSRSWISNGASLVT